LVEQYEDSAELPTQHTTNTTNNNNNNMEGLAVRLCPLPKAIVPLHDDDEGGHASVVTSGLCVCPVVQPRLASAQRDGLLAVARRLVRALQSDVGLREVRLEPTFFLPTAPATTQGSARRPIDAIYVSLVATAAIDEAHNTTYEPVPVAVWAAATTAPTSEEQTPPEGYTLRVDGAASRVEVAARSCRGAFYGVQTLRQLFRAANWPLEDLGTTDLKLPQVVIADQPDFAARGVMLDVSRDKGTE